MIIKLEALDPEKRLRYTDIRYVWVNGDDISYVEPITRPEGHAPGSIIWTRSGGTTLFVAVEPDDLARALDPKNYCPDPVGECSYYGHYLAYGGPDLTHAGFHAATAIHDRHAKSCRVYESGRACPVCLTGERLVRA